jgi:adenylate cyclase
MSAAVAKGTKSILRSNKENRRRGGTGLSEETAGVRRLAAVMFTDIVGYGALTQSDETQALQVLERHNRLLKPFFLKFRGKEIKAIGDSFLVEFDSALEAATCALEIQRYLHDFNISSKDDWKIKIRIGIHLGDVVHRDDDIFGDAVNIASRIEPLASPEGICVSQQVFDQVRNKFDHRFLELDRATLKNISTPIGVYKVVMPWEESLTRAGNENNVAFDRNRIAILPLANFSPDANDDYFADGMTEELISTISRISGLHVISRTSVSLYKNTQKKVGDIAKDLGVGTIVEGSVRKSSNRIRVAIQLIDVGTDEHLWSENYDRQLEDVFGIQSDIAQKVAESLKVRLLRDERKQVERIATSNTEALNLYFKGRYFWRQRTNEGLSKAIELFERAVANDLNYARGFSGLADCYLASGVYGLPLHRKLFLKQRQSALRSIEIDETLAEGHCSLAIGLAWGNDFEDSRKEFEKAIELNANYSTSRHFLAQTLAMIGRYDEAMFECEKARDLDPQSPTTTFTIAFVHRMAGEVEKARSQLENYRELDANYFPINLWLGLLYAETGKFTEGIDLIKKASFHLPIGKPALAYAYVKAGMKAQALDTIDELQKLATDPFDFVGIAAIYHALDMREKSSLSLDKAFAGGALEPDFLYIFYPWFRGLWSNEKFRSSQKIQITN